MKVEIGYAVVAFFGGLVMLISLLAGTEIEGTGSARDHRVDDDYISTSYLIAAGLVGGAAKKPRPCVHEEGRRNPFVYFRSLLEHPRCAEADSGLDRLALDLQLGRRRPPSLTSSPTPATKAAPCPATRAPPPARLPPKIPAQGGAGDRGLAAYEEGGLIAITSIQAPQAGPEPDTSACCVSPPYPNLPTLLGLERLGYANEPALAPFGETVFNAAVGEEAPLRQRRGLARSRFRRR